MLSRVLLAASLLSSVLFSSVVAQGPQTYCSPVTVDAFAVVASTNGQGDREGTMLALANGAYPVFNYVVSLNQPYLQSSIFFDVALAPNVTSSNYAGLLSYGFTIQLNNVYKQSSANSNFFGVSGTGVVTSIEFNNFQYDPRQRVQINNTLTLNVSEIISITNPANANQSDVTQCDYIYNFLLVAPLGPAGTGAFVAGDPQFKGLRGQNFQVHGVDGAVYNLISDKDQQLNTRFTFLEGPRPCPVMPSTGKVSAACWSHPGSYLSELALKTSGGSQLLIVSGEASQGFASVTLNGKALALGSTAQLAYSSASTGSVSLDNSHELTIRSGLFELVVENNDGFVNLRSVSVSAANWPKLAAHGLLGQTWQNKRYGGKIKEIEGDVDDYLIEDDNMFGDSFLFNQFSA